MCMRVASFRSLIEPILYKMTVLNCAREVDAFFPFNHIPLILTNHVSMFLMRNSSLRLQTTKAPHRH